MKKRVKWFIMLMVIILSVGIIAMGCSQDTDPVEPDAKPPVNLVSTIGREGTAGFVLGTDLVDAITRLSQDAVGRQLRVTGIPYSIMYNGIREVNDGSLDIVFSSAMELWNFYQDEGPFKENPVDEKKVYYGFNIYDNNNFFVVPKDSDIETIYDLNGKKVFPFRIGGSRDAAMLMFNALGIKVEEVQMDYNDVASSLQSGIIDAGGIFNLDGGRGIAPYAELVNTMVDIKIVKITDADIEKMRKDTDIITAGLKFNKVPHAFTQSHITEDKVWAATVGWGWSFGAHLSEDVVYDYMKVFTSDAVVARLKDAHAYWRASREEPEVTFFIGASPDVLFHPGVAKFYKEKGWWDDSWMKTP